MRPSIDWGRSCRSTRNRRPKPLRVASGPSIRAPICCPDGDRRFDDAAQPDLLRKTTGGYLPGDIKSGAGEEGGDEDTRKPKLEYAIQLCLYVDILEREGFSAGKRAFVWDIHGAEVKYDLVSARGPKTPETFWDVYIEAVAEARGILNKTISAQGAYGSSCKNCHWYSYCIAELTASDDLTLIPFLGRSLRASLEDTFRSVSEFAVANADGYIEGKKTVFKKVGPDSLRKFIARAKLIKSPEPKPFLRAAINIPFRSREIFFDIEDDPMRDVVYLHGFIEREAQDNATEKFTGYFANDFTADAEKKAFTEAVAFLHSRQPATIFYYSKHERTKYRKLQQRYPDVCTADRIEALFHSAQAVDLYFDVVLKAVEFPTIDYSLKTLAKFLGFKWQDKHPSGAASIEWFDQWIKTKNPAVRQRILEYNEDDCRATRVLLDGIRSMAA